MPLLLIKRVDATNPDPDADVRGCYKRGDVVAVYDDSKHDGDTAANPISELFWVIRVTGLSAGLLKRFEEEARDQGGAVSRRRAHGFDPSLLPGNLRNALEQSRYLEIPWPTFRAAIRNKATGVLG